MSTTDPLRQALEAPFPDTAIKQRQGGGNSKFSYVEGFTIIRRLNEATQGHWDWAIKSFEFRALPNDRNGKEQSLVVVTGELTIPGLGTRAGIGVQKVSENGGEDLVKGASTDALKKAATLFGVALDLYGPDYESGEVAPVRRNAPPAFVAPRERPAPPAAAPQSKLLALATIRDNQADPQDRKKALHAYYSGATTVAELNERSDTVVESGMEMPDLKAGYRFHHDRLSKQLAPPASYAG